MLAPGTRIKIIEPVARARYRNVLRQAFALRHRVFVGQRHLEFMRDRRGLECDCHDSGAAIHILALHQGQTIGHVRIIPGGYLVVAQADPERVTKAAGGAAIDGLSRFCLAPELRMPLRETIAIRLFMAALHHVLQCGTGALLFETDPAIVFMLRVLGFSVQRVGEPAPLAGRLSEPVVVLLDASVLSALPMRIAAWRRRPMPAEQRVAMA